MQVALSGGQFACFVAGEIIQVIEAMPGSVVPLAMFIPKITLKKSDVRVASALQIGQISLVKFLLECKAPKI